VTISIDLPKGDSAKTGIGTRVFNSSGVEIDDVTSIDISIRPDEIISATLEVHVSDLGDMKNVHALLGTRTLEHIAKLHGYELKRINNG
tara:strand:- start:4606 stop:4872 length:267 start_codon:yes stop_codon:yes gene_type:complete